MLYSDAVSCAFRLPLSVAFGLAGRTRERRLRRFAGPQRKSRISNPVHAVDRMAGTRSTACGKGEETVRAARSDGTNPRATIRLRRCDDRRPSAVRARYGLEAEVVPFFGRTSVRDGLSGRRLLSDGRNRCAGDMIQHIQLKDDGRQQGQQPGDHAMSERFHEKSIRRQIYDYFRSIRKNTSGKGPRVARALPCGGAQCAFGGFPPPATASGKSVSRDSGEGRAACRRVPMRFAFPVVCARPSPLAESASRSGSIPMP